MLDTSDIKLVKKSIINEKATDILVLNTGGPPAKGFVDISEADWNKYYRQLFLSFCLILKGLKINKGGYVFLVSSYNVKEPDPSLILSNSFRIAFVSVFKSVSKIFASDDISCINIAPGSILTDLFIDLVYDLEEAEKNLPFGRAGKLEEIGNFVKSIVQYNIKYLSGVTINIDGALSKSIF